MKTGASSQENALKFYSMPRASSISYEQIFRKDYVSIFFYPRCIRATKWFALTRNFILLVDSPVAAVK
jgi:hypothetical protein